MHDVVPRVVSRAVMMAPANRNISTHTFLFLRIPIISRCLQLDYKFSSLVKQEKTRKTGKNRK
jgi:hypothetical protein